LATLDTFQSADYYVGTFTSAVGRLTALLRAARGLHPVMTVSVEPNEWKPTLSGTREGDKCKEAIKEAKKKDG